MGTSLKPEIVVLEWYLSFYKHKDFNLVAIHDEGQNSLFETIIEKLESFNTELYTNEIKGKMSNDDISYISYKYATMQAMLVTYSHHLR